MNARQRRRRARTALQLLIDMQPKNDFVAQQPARRPITFPPRSIVIITYDTERFEVLR